MLLFYQQSWQQNVEKAWKWSTPFNGGLLIVAVAVVGLIVFAFEGWSFAQFVSDYFGWKTFNVGKRQCDQMLDLKVVQFLPQVAQNKSKFFYFIGEVFQNSPKGT